MKIKITSDLVSEPLSLTEAKNWMRINDFTSDDTLITSLIKSTRSHLERFTGLSFGVKTIEAILDIDYNLELPYGPINSIVSVYKLEGEEWVADTNYKLLGDTLLTNAKGKYKVAYVAGYVSLPEDILTDIKSLVAWQYENRGITIGKEKTVSDYPKLLNSVRYRKVVI